MMNPIIPISAPLPHDFNRWAAMAAVNGRVDALRGAFLWGDTQHGHDYWAGQIRFGALSSDARKQLQAWIAEDEASDIPEQGDIVRALESENPGEEFTAGKEYEVEYSDGVYVNVIADDAGDPNGGPIRCFELVERAAAA